MEPNNVVVDPKNASANQLPGAGGGLRITFSDVIIAIFFVLVLIEFFFPAFTECEAVGGGRSCQGGQTLTMVLGMPTLILGVVAGLGLTARVSKSTWTRGNSERVTGALVGFAAGTFVIILGIIGAFVGSTKGQPGS